MVVAAVFRGLRLVGRGGAASRERLAARAHELDAVRGEVAGLLAQKREVCGQVPDPRPSLPHPDPEPPRGVIAGAEERDVHQVGLLERNLVA
eukprot:3164481-Rhodomonas_salina.2